MTAKFRKSALLAHQFGSDFGGCGGGFSERRVGAFALARMAAPRRCVPASPNRRTLKYHVRAFSHGLGHRGPQGLRRDPPAEEHGFEPLVSPWKRGGVFPEKGLFNTGHGSRRVHEGGPTGEFG